MAERRLDRSVHEVIDLSNKIQQRMLTNHFQLLSSHGRPQFDQQGFESNDIFYNQVAVCYLALFKSAVD